MVQSDVGGLVSEVKNNKGLQLILLILGCVILYLIVSKYLKSKNNFNDIRTNILFGSLQGQCKGDIPRIDEAIIRNMIELPNRNPKMLTSSMVIPEVRPSDEERRKTRMEVLNMFYNSFDDDTTTYNNRPKGLYVIP
jgi:hypothetical protein